jgi:hypothetical protein
MAAKPVPLLPLTGDPRGWSHPVRRPRAHALYNDGIWRTCQVLGWLGARGQWYLHVRWPDGQTDWRKYDHRYIHPA